jgi:hypothetical protein
MAAMNIQGFRLRAPSSFYYYLRRMRTYNHA